MPDDGDTEHDRAGAPVHDQSGTHTGPTVQGKINAREPGGAPAATAEGRPSSHQRAGKQPASRIRTGDVDPASRAAPATGLGRYDLGELLGRGGMGEVVSARDEQIGREVAIKRMRADQPSPQAVVRFLREARIQGQLEHPAVVPVHELSRDADGQPYFVMKQLSGITLSDVLASLAEGDPDSERLFTRQRLLRAFCEVCIAVEFAHSRNIVHRDLKPANIMLGDFGEVHVLDWGIARVIDDEAPDSIDPSTGGDDASTIAGTTLGTPGYMSAEQQRGELGIDGRTDVYALGCILFEILTLRTFHPRGAPYSRIEPVPSKRAPDREIPPELDAICLAATQRERVDRYATARELGDAVQRFLDGDRDLAVRKQIAGNELAAARSALARDDRPIAITAAARALALDPTSREAADLVARLMLEPPKTIPPEVDDAIAAVDLDALHASRKLIASGGFVFLVFVPLMLWIGFRDPAIIGGALGLAVIVSGIWFVPRQHIVLATRVALVAIAVAVALVARSLTPFLIAPGIAAIAGMAIATHPRVARPWAIIALFGTAIFVPWLLELAEVVSRTTAVVDNTIVLTAATDRVDPTAALVVLSASALLMVVLAITFGAMLSATRRASQRAIQVQTWQLGQLVPRAADRLAP